MQKYRDMVCPGCGAVVFFEEGRTRVSCHACGLRIAVGEEREMYLDANAEVLMSRRSTFGRAAEYVRHLFDMGTFADAV